MTKAATKLSKEQSRKKAESLLEPGGLHGIAIGEFVNANDLDVAAQLLPALDDRIAKAIAGDIGDLKGLLVAQMHLLNTVFVTSMMNAKLNQAEYPAAHERYMRLGLKAQAQCRATVETVARLVNPEPPAPAPISIETLIQVLQQINVSADHDGQKQLLAGQPHVQSAFGTALLGENAGGRALPVSGDAGETPLLSPRRRAGVRSAEGQSQRLEARRKVKGTD